MSYNPNRPLANQKRNAQNYQKYMDKMSEALNKNMEKNIFPHWRNHSSLKGKSIFKTFITNRLVLHELPINTH
jgi:hypothetical protein